MEGGNIPDVDSSEIFGADLNGKLQFVDVLLALIIQM